MSEPGEKSEEIGDHGDGTITRLLPVRAHKSVIDRVRYVIVDTPDPLADYLWHRTEAAAYLASKPAPNSGPF